jgi:hypothetical protein
MHLWYSLNLGKCNSCLTYHSSRKPYCSFSIHISLHHTCASLSHLISFIPNWYYYQASYQEASQCIKYMYSSINTHKPNQTFIMQAHFLHPFHVMHAHGHLRTSRSSSKDIASILMTSLIGTLNTEFPSQLRACSHSHDIHMEVESDIVITMFPFYTIIARKKTLLP